MKLCSYGIVILCMFDSDVHQEMEFLDPLLSSFHTEIYFLYVLKDPHKNVTRIGNNADPKRQDT